MKLDNSEFLSDTLPEPDEVILFLNFWFGDGAVTLISIVPDGAASGDVLDLDQPNTLLSRVSARNKTRNIHYHVNRSLETLGRKAPKSEIVFVDGFHVDIDPDKTKPLAEERARIAKQLADFQPKPTVVIDSGGGMQALFKLAQPIDLRTSTIGVDAIEDINRGMARALGGDEATANIDRLMRVPGTWNHPNQKKRAAGRNVSPSRLVEINETATYSVDDFANFAVSKSATVIPIRTARIEATKGLDELNLKEETWELIRTGKREGRTYQSRSEAVMAVACELVRAGATNEAIESILLDSANAISQSILEKGAGAPAYAHRQADRARKRVSSDFIRSDSGIVDGRRVENISLALNQLGIEVRLNEHSDRFEVIGLENFGPNLDDGAVDRMFFVIEALFKTKLNLDIFVRALQDVGRGNRYHPVRDYLRALVWDGVPRVARAITTYFGAADSAYVQEVAQVFFTGAVRRVMQPGVKFDETLVLEGPQGAGKSEGLRRLVGNDAWFSDDFPLRGDGKDVIEAIEGKWIIEIAELAGMPKAAVDHVKALQSRSKDRARRPYARYAADVPRQSVFVGTTNETHYLRDLTGNRRFLPVRVGKINLDAIAEDRDQLWAEAVQIEKVRKNLGLPQHLWPIAAEEQAERVIEDPWFEVLDSQLGGESNIKVSANEVWDMLGLRQGEQKQADNKSVGHAMKRLGFQRTRFRDGLPSPVHGYVRGPEKTAKRWRPNKGGLDDQQPM